MDAPTPADVYLTQVAANVSDAPTLLSQPPFRRPQLTEAQAVLHIQRNYRGYVSRKQTGRVRTTHYQQATQADRLQQSATATGQMDLSQVRRAFVIAELMKLLSRI